MFIFPNPKRRKITTPKIIRNKIKKNPSLSKELSLIDEAYITTFDSFALSIVKKYHYILNISPNVSIIDGSLIRIKKKEILTNIFDKYYENRNEKFLKLISDFCIKDDKEIFDSILSIYSKIDLKNLSIPKTKLKKEDRIDIIRDFLNSYDSNIY